MRPSNKSAGAGAGAAQKGLALDHSNQAVHSVIEIPIYVWVFARSR